MSGLVYVPALHGMQALYAAVQKLVDAAGMAGVQVLCLQEAWTMPFAFCTREREWLEFAEPAETGPSTKMLQQYAQKYNMVIINSILERDEPHGETIWNTAVVIGHMGNVIGKYRKVLLLYDFLPLLQAPETSAYRCVLCLCMWSCNRH